MNDATTRPEAMDPAYDMWREKVLFGLSIYPVISPSMLHIFVGTAVPKSLWKDVILKELIQEGLVVQENITLTSPHDRVQTYTLLRLATTPYVAPADAQTEQAGQ